MRNIVVVDCLSTGINFIADIVNRGYNPVVLEMQWDSEDAEEHEHTLKLNYDAIDYEFDMIYERDTYEETLEAVKKWDPLLVLAGNEHGVVLATKLASDLNLLGNPIENMDYFTLKHKMQEKLAEAGLRHIKGKTVKSIEEAVEFYESEGLKEVVIKPIYSAGSVGVHLCSNKQEMIDAIKDNFSRENYYGQNIEEVVIQERINGEEYIVNTVSCGGVHRLTLVWKYNKVVTQEGGIIYDTCMTVNRLSLGEAEMIEYAYDVADALGIEYGPVHGEYMVDENGPVLIEVNCRPCGGNMPAPFLDRISGQHETDSILDAYLKPELFHQKRKQRYDLLAHGALKFFIVPKDINATSVPMNVICSKLKSYYSTNLEHITENQRFFMKTEDLETSCGFVYMVHKDSEVIKDEINFLRDIENHAFSLVLSDKFKQECEIDEDEIVSEIRNVVDITEKYGTGLLITDQFIDDIGLVQSGLKDFKEINGEFDYVIINLNKSLVNKRDDECVEIILNILLTTKIGGFVCIPESTYNYIPSKRKGVEALIEILDLRIEAPLHGINSGIIASKEVF